MQRRRNYPPRCKRGFRLCRLRYLHGLRCRLNPNQKDGVAGSDILITPRAPLPVRGKPRNALRLTARKARLGKSSLSVAPGHKAGAPSHAAVKAVPAPVRRTAYIADLRLRYIHKGGVAGRVPFTNCTPLKSSDAEVSAEPPPKTRGLLPLVCK